MKLLSDRIQEFIDWMIDETDFGDWSDKAQDEVHKKLIVFMISDSKETLLAAKPAPTADNCTCWIGRGEHGGSDRHLCSIHKEPVAPPAPTAGWRDLGDVDHDISPIAAPPAPLQCTCASFNHPMAHDTSYHADTCALARERGLVKNESK